MDSLQATSSTKQPEISEQLVDGCIYEAERSVNSMENCFSSQMRHHQLSNGELVPQMISQQQIYDPQHVIPIVSCSAITEYQHQMATG